MTLAHIDLTMSSLPSETSPAHANKWLIQLNNPVYKPLPDPYPGAMKKV